jgi:two-component system chemotaxis response regulator CheY
MSTPVLTTVPTTVLTVDDSRAMRDMLRHSLVSAGFRVLQAEDGLQGLEVLATETPDVIVTDINMPRMDGFGFIEAVRRDESRRAMPVLVLTTEVDVDKKNRARAAGATGWIVKPFDPVKLVEAIRRVSA